MTGAPVAPGYQSGGSSGGSSAAPTTDPSLFQLKGFNTGFQLKTVQPGATVPSGVISATRQVKPGVNLKTIPSADRGSFISTQATTATKDVTATIQEFDNWSNNTYDAFRADAYSLGLTNSKNASKTQVALAWQTVVETASQDGKSTDSLMKDAKKAGSWNGLKSTSGVHPNDVGAAGSGNKNSGADSTGTTTTNSDGTTTTSTQSQQSNTSETAYKSYLDPATVQGILHDSFYRLMGRAPNSTEYQAFLNSIYSYEDKANSGTFETGVVLKDNQKVDEKTGNIVDKTTGAPIAEKDIERVGTDQSTQTGDTNTNKTVIKQRGLSTSGAQFMAGQTAMATPEAGAYQASTTYFNALIKALTGPAAGMQGSGPTGSTG